MSFLRRLFGQPAKDPKATRKQADETRRREAFERSQLALAAMRTLQDSIRRGVIDCPATGHPCCPLCKAKQAISAEQMRIMMSQMDKNTVPTIICDACGAHIRVRA